MQIRVNGYTTTYSNDDGLFRVPRDEPGTLYDLMCRFQCLLMFICGFVFV